MIRFLLRFIGLMLLALGFIFLIYDGIRSISDGNLLLTRTAEFWISVHQKSFAAFQALVEQKGGADLWRSVLAPVLEQPAWAIAGVIGVVLLMLGRKRKPLIGYARD